MVGEIVVGEIVVEGFFVEGFVVAGIVVPGIVVAGMFMFDDLRSVVVVDRSDVVVGPVIVIIGLLGAAAMTGAASTNVIRVGACGNATTMMAVRLSTPIA